MARKSPRRDDDSVQRTIQFFRIDVGKDEESALPMPFDHSSVVDVIRSLRFDVAGEGGYLRDSDGDDICVLADHARGDALRLGRVRRSAFPMLESAGTVSPLELDERYGLLESIHVVFFPGNIVGSDYNHFGPRISQLARFFGERCGVDPAKFSLRPLLKRDAAEQLERLTAISVLDLKVRPNYVQAVAAADGRLGASLSSVLGLVRDDGAQLQIVIRPGKPDRFSFRDTIMGPLVQLARRDDIRQGATRFEVKGTDDDHHNLVVNVLKDHLVTTRPIFKMSKTSRALHDASAYAAIVEAYNELRRELEQAAEVVT